MSNVTMKIKSGFSFPKRDSSSPGYSINYPKIEIIKALRSCFGLSLKGAKELAEVVVEQNSAADVTISEDHKNVFFERNRLPTNDFAYLCDFFEFRFEGEPAAEVIEAYRKDIRRLLNKALDIKRFDDSREIIHLLENLERNP